MAMILEINQVITESDVIEANCDCENTADADNDEDIDIEL